MSRQPWSPICLGLSVACTALLVGCGEPSIPREAGSSSAAKGPDGAGGGKQRFVFLTNGNSPYWDACRAGIQDAEKELKLAEAGFTAIMETGDGTVEGQLNKLKQFGGQADIAGIAVSVQQADNAAIAAQLKELRDKGIPILAVDSDVERSTFRDSRDAFIGTDNVAGGQVLGQCAKALRPDGGEFVSFVGDLAAQNAKDRIGGFAAGAGEKFVAKDAMPDANKPDVARENVRNALLSHPQLNTLVGIWSYNAPAIVDVLREKNRRKDFAVVVFDAEPLTIQAAAEGNIDAMVVQNPYAMGLEAIRLLKALKTKDDATVKQMLPNFGQPEGDIFDTGLKVVVPSADSPVKKDLFSGNVEFLTLDEFKAWLAKYNLTQS